LPGKRRMSREFAEEIWEWWHGGDGAGLSGVGVWDVRGV
jgi:hypothetical protein